MPHSDAADSTHPENEAPGQGLHVSARNQVAGFAVTREVCGSSCVEGSNGSAMPQGLEPDEAQTLGR